MFLGYLGRFLLLAGLGVLLAALVLGTATWLMGGLLIVLALFMVAIAYALRLPP
jgi:hypothetical protein